ncbi:hypothetical protein [Devosia pacifica]|uniref:hypothetical protein n=1 Tax=Devosia pacifica TaxID=1335967 RepID=UPI001673AD7E|nr:hypothetical protein [Devosia pacifica]
MQFPSKATLVKNDRHEVMWTPNLCAALGNSPHEIWLVTQNVDRLIEFLDRVVDTPVSRLYPVSSIDIAGHFLIGALVALV